MKKYKKNISRLLIVVLLFQCMGWQSVTLADEEEGYCNIYDIDLSEAALSWFMYNTPVDPLGGTVGDENKFIDPRKNGFDTGGHPKYASPVVAGWVGPNHEELAKYSDVYQIKTNGLDPSLAYIDEYHVTGFQETDISSDRDSVKRHIMENGAVTCSVYNNSSYYDSGHNSYYYPYSSDTNHAVTLVGWDDNFPKEDFRTSSKPAGNGAWIVRNSGTNSNYTFSKSGYYYLSYYDNSLASNASVFSFEYEDGKYQDNCYQYDGGMLYAFRAYTNYAYAGNIFTVSAGSAGEAVTGGGFFTGSPDQFYTISLYTDVPENASSPVEGTQAAAVSGYTTEKGYYSSYFDEPVYVEPGSRFAIVVRLEKDGETCSIGYEADSPASWSIYASECQSADGQGYLYTSAEGWKDANRVINASSNVGGNLRIKAYTVSADRAQEVREREEERRKTSSARSTSDRSSSEEISSSSDMDSSSSDSGKGSSAQGSSKKSSSEKGSSEEEDKVIKTVISADSIPEGYYGITYDIGTDIATVRNLPTVTIYRPSKAMKAIRLPKPVRTGYTFKGWRLGSKDGAKITRITKKESGDLYLVALWEPIKYTISFLRGTKGMTKDTAGKINKIKAVYDEEYILPEGGFLKTGYDLVGYTTDKQGRTVKYYPGEKVRNLAVKKGKTVKLYAVWELSEAFRKKDPASSSSERTAEKKRVMNYGLNEEVFDESFDIPETEEEYEGRALTPERNVMDDEECVMGSSDDLPGMYMTPNLPALKSQGSYNTCWAFAMIACAEIYVLNHDDYKNRYEIKGKYKMPDPY